jgi:hypothetical protein
MNPRPKPASLRIKNPAYRPAFERLEAALAANTRSRLDDIRRIDRLRLAVFGSLPETAKPLK